MNRGIRKATAEDIDDILKIMDAARQIMRSSGNLYQWTDGYPSADVILGDIEKGGGYVVEDDKKKVAYFAFLPAPEPTYEHIYQGRWLEDDRPYHVIHRMASYPNVHKCFHDILIYCLTINPNIRIDTHRDNGIMQHNILKHGFTYCGIIYLANGDERLAYQNRGILMHEHPSI